MDEANRPVPEADDPLLEPLPFQGATPRAAPAANDATRSLDAPAGAASPSTGPVLVGSPMSRLAGPGAGDEDAASRSLDSLSFEPARRFDPPPMAPARSDGARNANGAAGTRSINIDTSADGSVVRQRVSVPTIPAEAGQEIRKRVTEADLQRLDGQITALYKAVSAQLAGSAAPVPELLSLLSEARTTLMAHPEQFPIAELRAEQARALLRQAEASQGASKRGVAGWNVFWLIVFLLVFAFHVPLTKTLMDARLLQSPATVLGPQALAPAAPPAAEGAGASVEEAAVSDEATPIVAPPLSLFWYFPAGFCVLAGGIGGAVSALFVLAIQTRRREYDPASRLEYFLNPVNGAVLGGLMYFVLLGGLVTAAASTTTLDEEALTLARQLQVASSPLFIVVAFIAGAAQQRVMALLNRIWTNVTGGDEAQGASAAPPPPATEVPVATEPAPDASPTAPPGDVAVDGSMAAVPPADPPLPPDAETPLPAEADPAARPPAG